MNNKTTNLIAFTLLAIMATTAFLSMKEDSLTFDELAHIPAGYSYLVKQDYRVNPEHPPLIKDIPALPLLFLDFNFSDESSNWVQEEAPAWWVQFDLGNEFIYHSGNNPREIIFWSRSAMILLLIFTGWFLFYWARQIGGNFVALGTLFLFAFSPTFLAHGKLVNTDLGAVFGVLIATFFWLKFLKDPNKINILLAGIAFGLAMVLKFSLILLIPFFILITFIYAIFFAASPKKEDSSFESKVLISASGPEPSEKKEKKCIFFSALSKKILSLLVYSFKAFLVALVGVIFVIWPIYQFHIWNYPQEQQLRDTLADISSHPVPLMKDVAIWMTNNEMTRPLAQYMRGLLMASQRTMWGNTAFFMGEISASSWPHYFPFLYLVKVPLAFHFLTFFVLLIILPFSIGKLIKKRGFVFWLKNNFTIIAFLLWIVIYWLAALFGNLNIGIRHLLPVFPFTYILIVLAVVYFVSSLKENLKKGIVAFVFLVFFWYSFSSLISFPYYISYYNELVGGTSQGYKIAVDSNYDWGQDFYRLLVFIEKNEIDQISLDYFGGEDPVFWLGEKYLPLDPKRVSRDLERGLTLEEVGLGEWLAVSSNHLMGGTAKPSPGFDQETGYYDWLKDYSPFARAGQSIFIYRFD